MTKQHVALIILDGLGIGPPKEYNPVYAAQPKTLKELEENFPLTSLEASGIAAGLPWGEPGNCETGHLLLGAGKIIYQNYPRITMAIRDGSFFKNEVLNQAFDFALKNNSKVNFVGLLTSGISEASKEHLKTLIQIAEDKKINFALHLFSDGEDSPPRSCLNLLEDLPQDKLASIIGRYYALDNKNNPDILKRAYDCLVGDLPQSLDWQTIIKKSYERGLNDNSLPPILINPQKAIKDGDSVIFFNFREDNIRPLVETFIDSNYSKFKTKKFNNLFIATMTQYFSNFNVPTIFEPQAITKPLSLILSQNNKTQFKISESLKYPLITFFFNGLQEIIYENEFRVSIPSDFAFTPTDHPELKAQEITDRLIEVIENQSFDFILANYANLDILGHSGNINASIEAIKIIDKELKKIVDVALKNGATLLITSDHGNIEQMINPQTGEVDTEHNLNPVPIYLVDERFRGKKFPNWQSINYETLGLLSDVAPTILELFDINPPPEMTGKSLLRNLF